MFDKRTTNKIQAEQYLQIVRFDKAPIMFKGGHGTWVPGGGAASSGQAIKSS